MKGESHVYFIQVGRRGSIKVGTSANPRARLRELQTANPKRLRLLGTVPGDDALERKIHDELRADRLSGEWFKPTPRVLRAIGERLGQPPKPPAYRVPALTPEEEARGIRLWREHGEKHRVPRELLHPPEPS